MQPDCSVVLLAGGKSTRMGTPKAWLQFAGQPLLLHLVQRMLTVFPEVVVVAAPGQDLPAVPALVVADQRPDEGPLAGLAEGLRVIHRPLAFASSCDAPFLNPLLSAWMVEQCEGYDAVVPRWDGKLQPLHAVYRGEVQQVVSERLASGDRRLSHLFRYIKTLVLEEADLREAEPSGRAFLNMNSPPDYQAALKIWNELYGNPES